MDIFSHGLYGGAAFGRKNKKNYLTALFFGMGPDLISFGPFFILNFFRFESWFQKSGTADSLSNLEPFGNLPMFPDIIHYLYNATHSFIVFIPLLVLFWIFGGKKFATMTLAWPLHIIVDIPTHSADFFPTHFLWPMSDFTINGIAWAKPVIFIPNLIILLIIYLYWYVNKKHSAPNLVTLK